MEQEKEKKQDDDTAPATAVTTMTRVAGLSKAQIAKRKNKEPTEESGLTVKVPMEMLDGIAYYLRWKYDIVERHELRGEDLIPDDIIDFIDDHLKFTCGQKWRDKPIRVQGRRKVVPDESD